VVAPPAGENVAGWPLIFDAGGRWYLKPFGGQLLASPADETPTEPGDVRAEEIDVALGLDRIREAFDLEIRTVRSAWAGLRTFAADGTPVAGPEPDDPTFVWLAGQGGYGIKVAPALARLTAAVIRGERPEGLAALSPARLRVPLG
jgi:D-arginine dehydrogenase